METATITITGDGLQNLQNLRNAIPLLEEVHIEAGVARRLVTGWLLSEVGNMLIGQTPQLVLGKGVQTVWSGPVLRTSSHAGGVGEVGAINVDAKSGELYVDEPLKARILPNARTLIVPPSPSTR